MWLQRTDNWRGDEMTKSTLFVFLSFLLLIACAKTDKSTLVKEGDDLLDCRALANEFEFAKNLGENASSRRRHIKALQEKRQCIKKPEISISTIEHNFLNHRFYYPGRAEWAEVTVTLVDPVSPDAAINTAAIIRASGYNPPKDVTDTATISKNAAVAAMGTVVISQIDSLGNAVEYKVILDDTTTTPDLIDQNIMYAKIFLKPARAIEFIAVDFVITRTGASFDD